MRDRIRLGSGLRFTARALRGQETALYRRVADQERAVLGVGALEAAEAPRFGPDGRADAWWLGHLAYGYKDRLERLGSRLPDRFGWPLAHWFVPRWVIEWRGGEAWLHARPGDAQGGLALAEAMAGAGGRSGARLPAAWRSSVDRDGYLRHAHALLGHIQRGDIYEVNYCIAHEAEEPAFDPFAAFDHLLARTDAPFAGFLRLGQRFALCCSPERFLALDGDRMRGEPMKGTRPRGASADDDARLRAHLAGDPKERSENVMAVDVMRNDLSRVAVPGSVRVPELCGVRTYARVHQLVSVIEGRRAAGRSPFDAVQAAFPMASMTGAPKISAMRLIDAHEERARGLYSGTLGFFAPDGTADLNVAIRTVLFDAAAGALAIPTGSALTAQCDAAAEWEECLVKFNSVAHAR